MNAAVDMPRFAQTVQQHGAPVVLGRITAVRGLMCEARGCQASVGDMFELLPSDEPPVAAEVVGLREQRAVLMPLGSTRGLKLGTLVRRTGRAASAQVGEGLLGRVVDPFGRPLDGGPPPCLPTTRPLHCPPSNPLARQPVCQALPVGVRSIDALLTLARGQRIGIFAGGGVGKSSLMAMLVRNCQADVAVVALIGERGREVEEFVHATLGASGLAKAVVVAATSAEPPLVRARGALYATAVAEHLRAQGQHVLLLMDSLTRYAMALREVALAVGEPPATKGYPPSVFAALPQLLERAGTHQGAGSITGIYSVLVEGDDMADPIADTARAILDGHFVLSRRLAERGHFPAIDIAQSISRSMPRATDAAGMQLAQQARQLLADYREAEDLLAIGAYQKGIMPRLDAAVDKMPALEAFLRQGQEESCPSETSRRALAKVLAAPGELR